MTIPTLTYKPDVKGVRVMLDQLVPSRMLVQANSGGGKSRALRQMLEETFGKVQHIVIDPEGEFATLRERFDYVLAAKTGGDVQATPKTAKLLCRRLVEIGASAILDLYELSLHERREFVKLFLTELMSLPRSLWRPILVVIDEIHVFAPESGSGESQSTEAVIALATQGRKRGFALVGATQRISKLKKDAAAELLNKMIGRTGLDVDVKRAGDELGLDKETRAALKRLAPGEFYVYGPAISDEVQLVRTGDVKTTHPEAGRIGDAAPPAPAKVRAMLTKLADLPQEAELEARTVADLERTVKQLRGDLSRAQKTGAERIVERPVVDERAVLRALDAQAAAVSKRFATVARDGKKSLGRLYEMVGELNETILPTLSAMKVALDTPIAVDPNYSAPARPAVAASRPNVTPAQRAPLVPRSSNTDSTLPDGEQLTLTAIAQYPDGVDRDQLSVLTGYKRSTRDAYVQRLKNRSFVVVDGQRIRPTQEGVDALGPDFTPLPTGDDLQAYWLNKLPEGEGKVLRMLIEAHPDYVDRDSITTETGYQRSTRDAYIQRLKARRLATTSSAGARASDTLFDGADL